MDLFIKILFYTIMLIVSTKQCFSQSAGILKANALYPPESVTINGKRTLYYELRVTNLSKDSIALKSIQAINNTDATELFFIKNGELIKRMGASHTASKNILQPGASGIVYFDFPIESKKHDLQILHRFEFETFNLNKRQANLTDNAIIDLSEKPPLVLGSPLRQGIWAAVYEPSWEFGHRRMIFNSGGKAAIPGRFAIDFIKLNSQGQFASGDHDIVKNWFGYENDVLAVANGSIAAVTDDFSESPTISGQIKFTGDKASGNYIAINLGNNNFAFYEHLKPKSIKVKKGQEVKKGDVIASLGFTGQSTGPHLHFHVADSNNTLYADGIPFVFERFRVLGYYPDLKDFGKTIWQNSTESEITQERPAPNYVIRF